MNFSFLLLLIFVPLLLPWVLRIWFHQTVTWQEAGINTAAALLTGLLVFYAGTYSQTHDTLIKNGEVTGKTRERVSCSHSYPCNCRTISSGKSTTIVCSTCYLHPYDVSWYVQTSIGAVEIDRIDSQGLKEPARWTAVQTGEPVSLSSWYTNYIKGAPDSIFHLRHTLLEKYPHVEYPKVYDYYRVRRVLNSEHAVWPVLADRLNDRLNLSLRSLGPAKQMNVVVVFTKQKSRDFAEALRQDWLGGKKNDAVIVWSVVNGQTNWVEVFSWSKNSMFDVTLENALQSGPLSVEAIDAAFVASASHFQRRPMSEFEYLKNEVRPPVWASVLCFLFSLAVSLGVFWFMHREDVFGDPYHDLRTRNYL